MDHASAHDVVRPATGMAHLLRVRQESLATPQGAFGALAVLDVNCCSVPTDDISGIIMQRRAVNQEPKIGTVSRSSQARFTLKRVPGLQRCTPFFGMFADVFGMKDSLPAPTCCLLCRHTRVFQPALIHEHIGPVWQRAPGNGGN